MTKELVTYIRNKASKAFQYGILNLRLLMVVADFSQTRIWGGGFGSCRV